MIAAFCPGCGGWTMFHREEWSATAQEWAESSQRRGDIVIEMPAVRDIGKSCVAAWSDEECEVRP